MKLHRFLFISFLLSSTGVIGQTQIPSIGQKAPDIELQDITDHPFKLSQALQKGPVALLFYRGGWCPYCNIQLRNIQADLAPQAQKMGAQIVALSADKVDEAVKTQKDNKLSFTIISDPDLVAHRAYGVSYTVPLKLVEKYKSEYQIDLEKSSGRKHHTIAIPSVFVIDQSAKVVFSHSDENYKVRAQNADILSALKKAQGAKTSP